MIDRAIQHIKNTARVPSFSSYEERLHPYVRSVFAPISEAKEIEIPGNNLVFQKKSGILLHLLLIWIK